MKTQTAVVLLAATTAAQASLLDWFRLEEGTLDPATNTVYSAASTNTGTLGGATPPVWVSTGLGPVPSPGTSAALFFDAATYPTSPHPNVMTTLVSSPTNGLAGNRARTVAAWVKPSPVQAVAYGTIVHWGPGTPNGARFTFKLQGTSATSAQPLRFEVQGGGITGTKNLADGNWHHVAVVVTNGSTVGNARLYVDGVLETVTGSGLTTPVNTYTNYPVYIGNTPNWDGARGFTGLIDDVRIYDHALTASEILELVYGSGTAAGLSAPLTDQYIILGDTNATAVFNAAVSGTPPLNIQWKFYGTNLPNETNATLILSPATPANAGPYTLTVSNVFGGTAANAWLRLNTAPIEPPRQAILAGRSAEFSVTMPSASTGYTYQWQTNGVAIPGATTSTLTLPAVSAADAGTNYAVVVTLDGVSATSAPPAVLSVLPVPASAYATIALEDKAAAYWRLGELNGAGVAVDQTGFYPAYYSNYTGFELQAAGALLGDADTASAFYGGNFIERPFNSDLSRTNGLTLEAWAYPNGTGARQSLMGCYGGLPNAGFELFISAAGQWVFRTSRNTNSAATAWDDLGGGTVNPMQWTHLVATHDGTTKRLYTNGVLAGTQAVEFRAAAGIPLRIGAGTPAGTPADFFTGSLDELAVYRRALTSGEVADHYLAATVAPGTPPSITSPPQNVQVILGDTNAVASFSVAASGSPRLTYQWRRNGVNVAGATNPVLTLPSAGTSGPATYSVAVTNGAGWAVSPDATLSYVTAPVSPAGLTRIVGGSATFSVAMPAYQTYAYQWKHAGTNLPGATQATLTLDNLTPADGGVYTVVATLGADSAESPPATLTVVPAPSSPYANIILGTSPAPIAYWRLGEANVMDPVTDLVAGRNGVYLSGAQPGAEGVVLGDANTAMRCTGASDSYAEVAYDAALNPSTFTIECWALVRGGENSYRSPFTCREWLSGTYNGFNFYAASNNRWEFWLGQGATALVLTGPAVEENAWVHLAATYDGTTVAFYVNGTLVTNTPSAYVPNPYMPIRIGAGGSSSGVSVFFRGLVDEVALFDSALSAATIASHYAGVFQPGSLPRFTQQPRSRKVLAGETYTGTVAVHSTLPAGVYWQLDGTTLPGAAGTSLVVPSLGASGNYTAIATNAAGSSTSRVASVTMVPGQATSVSFRGSGTRTIAANGNAAGYVLADHWNEIGAGLSSGSATGLVDASGADRGMSLSWSAAANGSTGVGFTDPRGDFALLDGWIEGNSTAPVNITLSGIPASYQNSGYTVYVYLGTEGVTASTQFGYVAAAGVTNYYHGTNLSQWEGEYLVATGTDELTLPEANLAVFPNLTASTLTITAGKPATLSGPARVSGLQLVANAPLPVALTVATEAGVPVLSWSGNWVLQKKAELDNNPNTWTDVTNTSPYKVPAPMAVREFYRLRSP